MAIKLERINEACETLMLNARVSLLQESEGLDEKTRAKSELLIHENIRYIKDQLTKGGILEEAQQTLASIWTQVICEDIGLDMNYDVPADGSSVNGGNVMNTVKDFGKAAYAKVFPDVNNSYAGGGMDNGKPSLFGQAVTNAIGHGKAAAGQLATQAGQFADRVSGEEARGLRNSQEGLINTLTNTQGELANYKDSQEALINNMSGTGAKAGLMADQAIASGKAAAAPYVEAARSGINNATAQGSQQIAELNAKYPNAGLVGAGVAGAGLAGYGARRLVNRVRRG